MRKTIRNVTIVVPVLMTSCQVSDQWKSGQVTAQTRMTPSARMNAIGRPVSAATRDDHLSNGFSM